MRYFICLFSCRVLGNAFSGFRKYNLGRPGAGIQSLVFYLETIPYFELIEGVLKNISCIGLHSVQSFFDATSGNSHQALNLIYRYTWIKRPEMPNLRYPLGLTVERLTLRMLHPRQSVWLWLWFACRQSLSASNSSGGLFDGLLEWQVLYWTCRQAGLITDQYIGWYVHYVVHYNLSFARFLRSGAVALVTLVVSFVWTSLSFSLEKYTRLTNH